MSTGIMGLVFDVEAEAQAFLDKCNQWLLDTYGVPDIWDHMHKHPERDQWWVTYSTRIDHLLNGLVPVEITCDFLINEYCWGPPPEPPPIEEPPPPPPPFTEE